MPDHIAVYYDGACGLCSREIGHYKKIAPQGVFEWVDITQTPELFTQNGFDLIAGLKALHARDQKGQFFVGADAFILIWRYLPGWRYFAPIANLPGIRHIARGAYKRFAAWRVRNLGYD